MPFIIKAILDIGPLFAFFIAYHFYGIMIATAVISTFSIITVYVYYHYEKRIAKLPLFTAAILSIFAIATLYTGDSTFIKLKPTILNFLFSITLFGGLALNKGLMKNILGSKLNMNDAAWLTFSKRWAYLFLTLAALNEIVWRNFSEGTWVKFKVFGLISITLIFLVSQFSFIEKNKTDPNLM
jgi:intracellular septation protein